MRALLLAAMLAATISPVAAATPFPRGLYVGNPNGSDPAQMKVFKSAFDAHNRALGGGKPKFFNIFIENAQAPSTWASSASWAAWSSKMSGDAYVGPNSGVIPLIGLPLGWSGQGWTQVNKFYLATAAGEYDAVWKGIVNAWADNGYKVLDFRIAYEMNGKFMIWSPLNSTAPDAKANFIRAFRRVATILHKQAAARGIRAYVHWNPATLNSTNEDATAFYPGNDYVDVISIDQYSPMFPIGYTNWSTGGTVEMADKFAWAAIPANRAHYWRYPNATHYAQKPTLHTKGWSIPQMLEFAKMSGKFIGVDETGVGWSKDALGAADDPEFPKFLAKILGEARASGIGVRNVNIWDAKLSDGDWDFRGGSKPLTSVAWKKYFGEGAQVLR
jgi:hypothetical protein